MEVLDRFRGDYFFLSNTSPAIVEFEGITYPSSEHAYQAAKSLNPQEREKIAQIEKGVEAKRAGATLTLRPDWDEVKVEVMRQVVADKFSRHPLREKLLSTGEAQLIEGNTWGDRFWGVCEGVGENWLGRILMETRTQLRLADQSNS